MLSLLQRSSHSLHHVMTRLRSPRRSEEWTSLQSVPSGVHLHGKGRAGVGLVTVVWVMGTELAHSAVASQSLQLRHATPYGAMTVSPMLR